MAITITARAQTGSTSNVASYASASYTPSANTVLIALTYATAYDEALGATFSGNGLTWTLVDSTTRGAGAVFVFKALTGSSPSTGAGTLTLDGSDTATGAFIGVYEFGGVDLTTPVVQFKHNNTITSPNAPTLTFDATTQSDSALLGFLTSLVNPPNQTPPSTWTEQLDTGHANPNTGYHVCYHLSPGAVSSVTYGSGATGSSTLVVVEIGAAAGTTYERTAAATAASSIATAGTFFSVFERTADAAGTGTVTVTAFMRELLRQTAASGASAATVTAFQRELLRQVAATGASSIATVAEFFSVYERAVAATAASGIATAGEIAAGFTVYERSVAASASSAATVSAFMRELQRAIGASAASGVATVGEFFSVFERTAAASGISNAQVSAFQRDLLRSTGATAASSVAVVAEFFTTFERQVAATAASLISTSGGIAAPGAATDEGGISSDGGRSSRLTTYKPVGIPHRISIAGWRMKHGSGES